MIGIYEYFENLYKHHFEELHLPVFKKIKKINQLISDHEEKIANPILEYIEKRNDIKLIGKSKIANKNRAPTISFTFKNKSSKEVSDLLIKNKIATRNDNFYAWRCLEALGIDKDDGVIRLSMTHYNSENDTVAAISALDKIK